MMKNSVVGLEEVAKHAGVSTATVSRVINGFGSIKEKTRQKVMASIEELNYIPNETARRLKLFDLGTRQDKDRKTFNIGIVSFALFSFSDPYFSKVLDGIDNEITDQKYNLLFHYKIRQLLLRPEMLVSIITPENVDGIICLGYFPSVDNDRIFNELKNKFRSVVIIHSTPARSDFDCIETDRFRSGYEAVKYLFRLGHRRIGYVGYADMAEPRFAGYVQGLKDMGISYDDLIVEGEGEGFGIEAGRRFAGNIFNKAGKFPTALFAASDLTAIGAIGEIQERGLNVPGDVSVVGYDDIEIAQHFIPKLTTFRVKKEDLGALAVRKLIERVKNPETMPSLTLCGAELIERNSCRKIT